jgi:hypothetical protein
LRAIGRWRHARGSRGALAGKARLEIRVLGGDRIDRGLAVDAHGLVLGLECGQLGFDFLAREARVLHRLLLAGHGIETVAVGRDEFALRKVAIDEPGRVDGLGGGGIVALRAVVAAQDEPAAANKRDYAQGAQQKLLPPCGLRVEAGHWRWRCRIGLYRG